MLKNKSVQKKRISAKDAIIQEIAPLLITALAKFKETLGEKKFDKRIKKAAKLLAAGIKPAPEKKAVVKKKLLKKVVKKVVVPVPTKKVVVKK